MGCETRSNGPVAPTSPDGAVARLKRRRAGAALAFAVAALMAVVAVVGVVFPAGATAGTSGHDLFGWDEGDLFGDDEESLFGGDEGSLFGGDEGSLFGDEGDLFGGSGLIVEADSVRVGGSMADELLVSEPFVLGGAYSVSLASEWGLPGGAGGPKPSHRPVLRLDSQATAYADWRPNKDVRFFLKGRAEANGRLDGASEMRVTATLLEMFTDFHANDRVYFRLGKQVIHWGVGHFFSPADIVNVGRLDPENPEADREGPVALKAHMPVGSNNYYLHVIANTVAGETRWALAPKAEWVIGGTEFGMGAYVRADRVPRVMATVSGSVGRTAVFGEFVGSYGSDRRFAEAAPGEPGGVRAVRKDDGLFSHATVGAFRSWNDLEGRFNVSLAAQYYYNGEGYGPGELERLWRDYAGGVSALLAAGKLSAADFDYPSRHYGALTVHWADAFGSRLSPGLFWLGNLQDGSGMLSASIGVRLWPDVRLSVEASSGYGSADSEYGKLGDGTVLTLRAAFSRNF